MVEQAIFAALTGNASLAALIANAGSPTTYRAYPQAVPQNAALPFVVYGVVETEPVKTLGGEADLARYVVQIDCYASSMMSAITMASYVQAALSGNFTDFKGLRLDRRSEYDAALKVFAVSQDFAIWY